MTLPEMRKTISVLLGLISGLLTVFQQTSFFILNTTSFCASCGSAATNNIIQLAIKALASCHEQCWDNTGQMKCLESATGYSNTTTQWNCWWCFHCNLNNVVSHSRAT